MVPDRKMYSYHIIFESAPIWLLVFPSIPFEYIYIEGCTSFSNFSSRLIENKIDLSLYNTLVNTLGRSKFKFSSPSENVIVLLSGSLTFLNDQSLQIRQNSLIYLIDSSINSRRKLPSSRLKLQRLSHVKVGGATNYESVYAYGGGVFQPKLSSLRRKIGDFIDYSSPPDKLTTTEMFLTADGILPIRHCGRLVEYKTHFSHNGTGYKFLSTKELSTIFGLSSKIPSLTFNNSTFPVVPVQILDSLLHPLLCHHHHNCHRLLSTTPVLLPPMQTNKNSTFLPTINQHLPHEWCQHVSNSLTAVKDDSAAVDFQVWDKRIMLLWPFVTTHHLNILRNFLLAYSFKSVYHSFITYLSSAHPVSWK